MEDGHSQRTILVVDDDRGLLRLMDKALGREGFATATATSGKEALEWLTAHTADLLLLDLKLQDMEGKELIRQLSERRRQPPFIIITGQGDERVAVEMMKVGARDYLVKDGEFLQFVPEVVKHALEQIETERRLVAAEEQVNLVQSVVDKGFSAVLIADAELPDPKVLYVNPAFNRLTGNPPGKVIGQPLSSLSGLTTVQQRLREGLSEREFLEAMSTYQTPEGERWGEWRVGPVKDRSGRITHWLMILRDISDRKRLEQQILEISDREQRRIGQDLHDGLCQQLAAIELMSEVLQQKLSAKSKPDAATAGEIAGHVRNAIAQTRLLARGLSPLTLDAEGLMSGLQEFASNAKKLFGVECRFECDPPVLVRDHVTAMHLFRIAQEAVSNAIKHGKATRILIQLERLDDRIILTISDNGAGFPQVIPNQKGMGLSIMQSRAGMIGGTLTVGNNAAGGVSVTCSVAFPTAGRQNRSRAGKTQKSKIKKPHPHR